MLTIGSVCSGIGGAELGLEAAGLGPVRWQVEIDPFARSVLARHWPSVRRYEDLLHVAHPAQLPLLEPVGLLVGGTPCQDLSFAGKGAGLDGSRSSLWYAMLAIVAHQRPRVVVWENVPGCVRRGLDRVVGSLRDLGYTVVATRLSARDVGAPHLRERVFVVGILPAGGGVASSLRTWPTPTVKGNHNKREIGGRSRDGLTTAVKRAAGQTFGPGAPSLGLGPLNPVWVERLMGFPDGWTDPIASPAGGRQEGSIGNEAFPVSSTAAPAPAAVTATNAKPPSATVASPPAPPWWDE